MHDRSASRWCLLLLLTLAAPARAATGLALVEAELDGVGGTDGLAGATAVAVSPDGAHVYVAARYDDAVTAFSRDPATGALTFVETEKDGLGGVDGLAGARDVAVSPDGAHVYVAGTFEHAIAVFGRNSASGALTFVERQQDGMGGVHGLAGVASLTVSPDGAHVYAGGTDDAAVAIFARNPLTGGLTFLAAEFDGVGGVEGLEQPEDVAVSPDGDHVYVGSVGAMTIFSRDALTGALTFVQVLTDGVDGIDGLADARSVAVSPDGGHVYVAGGTDDSVAVFSRNPGTGALTPVEVQLGALYVVMGVAVSPDGSHVYAAASGSNAVFVFLRDPATGRLMFIENERHVTGSVDGLALPHDVAVAPDGAHVYAASLGDSAVAAFRVVTCGTPMMGCRAVTAPLSAVLRLADRAVDTADQLAWRWLRGSATDLEEFGDPVHNKDDYLLCLWDESGGPPELIAQAIAPDGGGCRFGGLLLPLCWREWARSNSITYSDPERTPDGLSAIRLKAGEMGRAEVRVRGQGRLLSLPALPLALPVRVQLQAGNGECWEASFDAAGVMRNDSGAFIGKGD